MIKGLMAAASAAGALLLAVSVPSTANAALTVVSACSTSDISVAAGSSVLDCAGWYAGNLLSGNPDDLADQEAALATLGFDFDASDWAAVDASKVLPSGGFYDFAGVLNGVTLIGIHIGATEFGQDATAFFKINASNLDGVTLNLQGGSSGAVYGTGGVVPEPATWAMMITGFGLAGAMLRRRREAMVLAK